jgi:predicted TIM-barrel fold metal-dependent hydrolase
MRNRAALQPPQRIPVIVNALSVNVNVVSDYTEIVHDPPKRRSRSPGTPFTIHRNHRSRWTEIRSYTPAPASLDDYLHMCEVMGIDRTVQVNASVYSFDNSLTLDLIGKLGQHRARGIAGVSPNVSAAELERLHLAGFRGARVSTHLKGYGGTDVIAALALKFRPLGWHVQLHVDRIGELAELEEQLLRPMCR